MYICKFANGHNGWECADGRNIIASSCYVCTGCDLIFDFPWTMTCFSPRKVNSIISFYIQYSTLKKLDSTFFLQLQLKEFLLQRRVQEEQNLNDFWAKKKIFSWRVLPLFSNRRQACRAITLISEQRLRHYISRTEERK